MVVGSATPAEGQREIENEGTARGGMREKRRRQRGRAGEKTGEAEGDKEDATGRQQLGTRQCRGAGQRRARGRGERKEQSKGKTTPGPRYADGKTLQRRNCRGEKPTGHQRRGRIQSRCKRR